MPDTDIDPVALLEELRAHFTVRIMISAPTRFDAAPAYMVDVMVPLFYKRIAVATGPTLADTVSRAYARAMEYHARPWPLP